MDFSSWLTDQQASAMFGSSVKTLERKRDKGILHPQKRPIPGRSPQRVWNPEEIQALLPSTPTQLMRQAPADTTSSTPMSELSGLPDVTWPNILDLVSTMIQSSAPPPPPAMWIPLKEASQLSGLSKAMLRRRIAAGKLRAVKDGAIKVRRAGLEDIDVSDLLMKAKRPAKKKARR